MRRVASSVPARLAWAGVLCLGAVWSSAPVVAGQRGRLQRDVPPSAPPALSTAAPSASFPEHSPLAGLSSAKNDGERCEAVLRWLQTGPGAEDPPTPGYRRGLPGQTIRIFRDEAMTAVFGAPYPALDVRRRRELHEKVLSRCVKSRAQEFGPYADLLGEAFLGEPGAFDASNIAHYLRRVADQIGWARQAMQAAESGAPSRQAFDELTTRRQAADSELALLTEGERAYVSRALADRQATLSPALIEAWLGEAERNARGVPGVLAVQRGRDELRAIVAALDETARTAVETRYQRLTETLVAEALQAQLARLRAVPPTLAGIGQLTAWKTGFDVSFAGVAGVPSVTAASREYASLRAERVAALLTVWQQEVAALPLDAAAITAKRRELDGVLAGRGGASPDLAPFEAAIRGREDRLREAVAADQQREREARAAATAAATPRPSAPAARTTATAAGPTPAAMGGARSFSSAELNYEKTLRAFHDGNFTEIAFNREDMTFSIIFRGYLNAYAEHCTAQLPSNRVEMTVPECKTETVTTNRWGVETNRYCSLWREKPTGLWADPILYEASRDTDRLIAGDSLKHAFRMMQGGDPIGTAKGLIAEGKAIQSDMAALVRLNACNGPGLKRFSENLRLFARNQPGLGDGGPAAVSAVTVPVAGLPFRDQNYARLVDDLVAEQAVTWVMNRYQPGSVSAVSVDARDEAGRPARLRAGYSLQGLNGAARGTVTVTFNDGLPTCLFFADAPGTCRTADRRIAARYGSGGYEK